MTRIWVSIPLERVVARLGGKIITVSDANTEKALRRRIGSKGDLIRIWNGVPDTALLARPGTHSRVTLISVARMVAQKDFATLLKAVATVKGNWRLQLVGDGPMRAEHEALAAQMGLGDRVEFLGNRQDVPELLSKADVFVLSTHWEGLPISILEAMRAGLPVVATDVGGVSESVLDGETGLITRVRDVADLSSKLQSLVDSPEMMAKLGMAGRLRFEAEFHIDTCVKKTIEIYNMVCRTKTEVAAYPHREAAR